jgi:MFS family permease
MAGLNFAFAYFKLPESLAEENRRRAGSGYFTLERFAGAVSQPKIALLMSIYFVVVFAFSNMEATFGLLNEHQYALGARETGYLFAYIGALMVVMQGAMVGRLVRMFGEKALIVAGTFCMVFGLGLMPFAPSIPVYCAIIALLSFGAGINNPSITSLLSRSSRCEEQGGIMGIAQSVASLGRILGPMWGGYTFGSVGEQWPFLSGGILMSLAFVLSLKNPADIRTAQATEERPTAERQSAPH